MDFRPRLHRAVPGSVREDAGMPTPQRSAAGGREFRFHEDWTLPVEPATVLDRLVDLGAYPTWWPQVRAVEQLAEDRACATSPRSRPPAGCCAPTTPR